MAYWSGLIFLLAAAAFVLTARRHRARALEAQAQRAASGEPEPKLHPSLSILVDVMPSLVAFGLICFAILITGAFFAVGASAWFSLFDLAAFLAMLGAYGYWLTLKSQHREAPAPRRSGS